MEQSTCGFGSPEIARTECQNQKDDCCVKLLGGGNKTGLIVGASVGGVVFLILIACAGFFLYKRNQRSKTAQQPGSFKVLHNTSDGNPFMSKTLTATEPVQSPFAAKTVQPPVPAMRDSIVNATARNSVYQSNEPRPETPNYDVLTDYGMSAISAGTPPPQPRESVATVRDPLFARLSQPSKDTFSANLEVSFANLIAPTPGPSTSVNPANLTTALELQGTKVVAIHPYEATLDDELSLIPGQQFIMLKSFDDGWALGLMDGKQGAFPLVCIETLDAAGMLQESAQDWSALPPTPQETVLNHDVKIARRLSSMILHDLAKNGTRSKVPFSTYIQELENMK
jgi:hypothetical protein